VGASHNRSSIIMYDVACDFKQTNRLIVSEVCCDVMRCVDDAIDRRFEVVVSVDNVGFPLQNALFAGQTSLSATAACYVRYKFYDRSMYWFCCGSVVND